MSNINLINSLSDMLSGKELYDRLVSIPKYNESIQSKKQTERLMKLSTLYDIYLPSEMTIEIYSKLYLALIRSLKKKFTWAAVQQGYRNHTGSIMPESRGIIGGADSFSIIGRSGIGKSCAINRAISIITGNKTIVIEDESIEVIPCLVVQCPWDASVKSMLLEILRKTDEVLGTNYYISSSKRKITTDVLIGSVSQVSLQHIGLLVIDEIQNCVDKKNGKSLVAMLTQLINNSGISICLVGTPETNSLFKSAFQLARRTLGLQYDTMKKDKYFNNFCKLLFSYQYVKNKTEITSQIVDWLYEHTNGITAIVVSLIHDAQEIAILTGYEILDINMLNQAYSNRMSALHHYIDVELPQPIKQNRKKTTIQTKKPTPNLNIEYSIAEIAENAKQNSLNIVSLFREYFSVEEIQL